MRSSWVCLLGVSALLCASARTEAAEPTGSLAITVPTPRPEVAPPNAPVFIGIALADSLRQIDRVELLFRTARANEYQVIEGRPDERFALVIPALSLPSRPEAYTVEYYVRGVDTYGGTLVEAGSADAPFQFRVDADPEGPSVIVGPAPWIAGLIGISLLIAFTAVAVTAD